MPRKIYLTEEQLKYVLTEEKLQESLTKSEVADIIKDSLKNNSQVKQELEKRVKEIVANSVNVLFRTLWQRRNFYEDEIKRG